MFFEPMHLRLIGLAAVHGDRPLLQVEVLDIESHHFAHAQGEFDEEPHEQRIPAFQALVLLAPPPPCGMGRGRFEAQALTGGERGGRGLLRALARGDGLAHAVGIEIAPGLGAVALDGEEQLEVLVGYHPGSVCQAAILAQDCQARVERPDAVALLEHPLAKALEEPMRHPLPGEGILIERGGLALDARCGQVGGETRQGRALRIQRVLGLLLVIRGKGIALAGLVRRDGGACQVVAIARHHRQSDDRRLISRRRPGVVVHPSRAFLLGKRKKESHITFHYGGL